jgi:type I restriction enzyme M protein
MARDKTSRPPSNASALRATADKLRSDREGAEDKHSILGLILLKYISEAFEERHARLQKEKGAAPEDRDEYAADSFHRDLRRASRLHA